MTGKDTSSRRVEAALPGSKSVAARAIVANALSPSPARLANIPGCDDSRSLAAAAPWLRPGAWPSDDVPVLDLGSGGTSLRFFLAAAASLPGLRLVAGCSAQLRARPVGPLLDALRLLGADVRSDGGKAPFAVDGRRLRGGTLHMRADVSSQFVSALMLAAPLWERGLHLVLESPPVSAPYIGMTAGVMRAFGAEAEVRFPDVHVAPRPYRAPDSFAVESDWSAASYLYEMAALDPGLRFSAAGLLPPGESLQGDSRCAELFARLGVATRFLADGTAEIFRDPRVPLPGRVEWDLGAQPDLVPALAATLCGLGVRFRLTGIAHLRHKETDRMEALAQELGRCGFAVEARADSLEYECGRKEPERGGRLRVRGDHRMAMSLAPLAATLPGAMGVDDPSVVSKSWPGYWDLFAAAARP